MKKLLPIYRRAGLNYYMSLNLINKYIRAKDLRDLIKEKFVLRANELILNDFLSIQLANK